MFAAVSLSPSSFLQKTSINVPMADPSTQLNINIPIPRGGTPATLSVSKGSDGRITIECKHPFVSNRFRWTSRSEEDESLYRAPPPTTKFPDEFAIWDFLQNTFRKWEYEEFPYSDYLDDRKPHALQAIPPGEGEDPNTLRLNLNIELLPEDPNLFAVFEMVTKESSETFQQTVNTNEIVFRRPLRNRLYPEEPFVSPKVIITCSRDPISGEVTVCCSHPDYSKGFQWKSGYGREFKSSIFKDLAAVWTCLMAEATNELKPGNSDSIRWVEEKESFLEPMQLELTQKILLNPIGPLGFGYRFGSKNLILPLWFIGKTVFKFAALGSRYSLFHCTHPDFWFGFQASFDAKEGNSKKASLENYVRRQCDLWCMPIGSLAETKRIELRSKFELGETEKIRRSFRYSTWEMDLKPVAGDLVFILSCFIFTFLMWCFLKSLVELLI